MEQQSIERFRSYLSSRLGLQFEAGAIVDLELVLEERLRKLGYDNVAPYFHHLESPLARENELRALAEQLTVGETHFFRHPDLIRAFSEVALRDCIQAHSQDRRLRILSAGCASGEEPYTLAMMVRDHLPSLDNWEVGIRGIDINHSLIEKAKKATYSRWSLRETPAPVKERYFRQVGSEYSVIDPIRQMVVFEERNLLDQAHGLWQTESFDIIFCRNVIIYLSPQAIDELVIQFERCLVPRGYLFLGHSETLRGISHAFDLCHTHNTFYYRRRQTTHSGSHRLPVVSSLPSSDHLPVTEDDTWAGTIQRASARIAALASTSASAGPSKSAAATDVPQVRGNAPAPNPSGHAQLALELFRQDRFEEALEQLDRIPTTQSDCDALLLRAAVLTNRGDLIGAEKVCAQVLRLDSLNPGAQYLSALGREHAGDRAGALRDATTAAYLDPAFAMPHLQLGFIAKRTGDPETARQEFGLALTLLAREDPSRILLFGGGFNREALIQLCRSELRSMAKEKNAR